MLICWLLWKPADLYLHCFYRAHILVVKDKGWFHNQQFYVKKMAICFLKVSMTISNLHYDISMTSSNRWKHGSQEGVLVHQERFRPVFAASEYVLSQITRILLNILHWTQWSFMQSEQLHNLMCFFVCHMRYMQSWGFSMKWFIWKLVILIMQFSNASREMSWAPTWQKQWNGMLKPNKDLNHPIMAFATSYNSGFSVYRGRGQCI